MATTRSLEDSEIQELLAAIRGRCTQWNRTMITVGIAGALRSTELVDLTHGDVYDENKVESYITICGETAKFGEARIIRIGEGVRDEIAHFMAFMAWKQAYGQNLVFDKPLFVSQKRGWLTRQILHVILTCIFGAAGIEKALIHFVRLKR